MRTPASRIGGPTQAKTQAKSPSSGLVALAQDPTDLPFTPGELIAGKYEVLKLIGSGGMGYVLSAMHVELGEVVALKFLRPEALLIDELVERFAREARAAAKIRSEHVARVFDVGTLPDGVPFIVMEHLEGLDLADTLQQQGPLPIKVAVEYVMQACEALAAAHAAGVVHRDIKPENLFLTRHAQGLDFIKILDFGISKVALTPGKRAFVRTMMPLGSPVYMSPEQIRASDQVDARTDIWSLGCVLFELLTGTVAFDEPTLMQLSAAILEQDPVPLRALLPDAPPELEAVVLKCLEKDITKRYSNIAELAIALYPFAPRRSRISAERCYHALKNAGIDCPEFEIVSVFPPSLSDMPLTSTNPGVSGSPVSGIMPVSAQPTVTVTTPDLRTSAPMLLGPDEFEELRPTKQYKRAGFVALGILAIAGIYFALHARGSEPAAAPIAAAPPPAAPAAVSPPVAAVTPTPAPLPAQPAAAVAPPSNTPSAAATPAAAPAARSYGYARHAAPVAGKPPPAAHRRTDGDEVDVGY